MKSCNLKESKYVESRSGRVRKRALRPVLVLAVSDLPPNDDYRQHNLEATQRLDLGQTPSSHVEVPPNHLFMTSLRRAYPVLLLTRLHRRH